MVLSLSTPEMELAKTLFIDHVSPPPCKLFGPNSGLAHTRCR